MKARYLYTFNDCTATVSTVEYDEELARKAVMVVSYQHDRFNIIKDRYVLTGTVNVKEMP